MSAAEQGPAWGDAARDQSGRLMLAAFARNWQARIGVGIVIAVAAFCDAVRDSLDARLRR
jgi:hypothetical protein